LEDNDLERAVDLVLDDQCGKAGTGDAYELVVELKAAETDQAAEGYVVAWGDDRGLKVPYGLTVCVDHAVEDCNFNESLAWGSGRLAAPRSPRHTAA
jgi:hypothetical protein